VKKVLFLLFTCLLIAALFIPACGPKQAGVDLNIPNGAKTIKVGVIGPMQYIQGEHNWWGAIMGAQKINSTGGFKVGDDTYYVDLIQSDSNEINSTTDAAAAMEKLITVDKAQFVIGGFRTEAVVPMTEIAMDNKTIFLDCGAATLSLCTVVAKDYNRYKYFFRITPFASNYLVNNTLYLVAMGGQILKEDTGINRPMKVAILSEGAEWADGMTNALKGLIPSRLKMEVVGTWRPSPTATELTAEMTAIQAADADIICTTISGPVGIPYARSWGELKVPAASIGINVEAQALGFWEATNGLGNYETTQSSYAIGVDMAPGITKPFVDQFLATYGQVPAYNAATYDALKSLTEAITRAGSFDNDAIVAEMEKTDEPSTAAPEFKFTGMDAPLGNPHDVTYGPGFSTGLASQWVDGKLIGVWPNPQYPPDETWANVNYPGIVKWTPPPLVVDRLKAEAATQPAAPAEQPATTTPTEQPSAPSAAPTTSYKAKSLTDSKYGFSIYYPSDWVDRKDLLTTKYHIDAVGVDAFIPGEVVFAFPADAPESEAWVTQTYGLVGAQDFKMTSPITDETLPGGQKAYTYTISYTSASGYGVAAYVMDVDKGTDRLRFQVFTVEAFAPYDGDLFSEIAHAVTFP
jgi:branched-chain amino acid transport system substrate-binding protein